MDCEEAEQEIHNAFEVESGNELYTVDICPSRRCVVFGGKSDAAEIYNYEEERTVTRIEDFSDSVIYAKFVSEDRFVIATADGAIALMEYSSDICIISLEEDISAASFNERLVVGASSGRVYLYDACLEHINTFGGHSSEIISVDYKEGRVLSMCANFLVVHDEQGRVLYTLRANEAYAFKYITSDVVCFAREGKIQIFKQTKKLFEHSIEERVECIELVDKSLVIGGDFDYILLIDTAGHYATFKLNIKTGVNMIKRAGTYGIVFSTAEGLIGSLDIRNVNTLRFFSPNLGVIFDLCVSGHDVAVAGQNGFGMVNIESDTPVELNE